MSAKVLNLYMTMPDLMRSGHRMEVEDFECNAEGIQGDVNYGKGHKLLLVSQKSYDLIDAAELAVDKGVLLENIFTDIDLDHLQKGSVIEIGETMFEVEGPCEAFGYLYALAPEIPDLLRGHRGIFITPMEEGRIEVGSDITVLKEA